MSIETVRDAVFALEVCWICQCISECDLIYLAGAKNHWCARCQAEKADTLRRLAAKKVSAEGEIQDGD